MNTSHASVRVIFISLILIVILTGAMQSVAQTLDPQFLKNVTYRDIGPTRQSGRFVDFAVSHQQSTTFYAATATGGLWKTTNNGISFEPLFAYESVPSIGDVAIAPSDQNILWVGTGESNNLRSSYYGNGVYKSTDAGKTWTNMGLKESHHIPRIIIHPTNPDIVYVAAMGHLFSENPERGLFKTIDGGKTWTLVLKVESKGKAIGVTDVVMDPRNPDILYAASYDRLRKTWTYNIGGIGSGIYKSIDAGKTWKKLAGGLPAGVLGRIGIDVSQKNPKILYTTVENCNKKDVSLEQREKEVEAGKSSSGMIGGEIYHSDDEGETWKKISPDGRSIGGAPAYFYGQIRIDPNDENVVYILSVSTMVTRDGGKNWNTRAFNFGGDDHGLWIDPQNSNHILLGFDHGMGVSYDCGKNWYHPDNLPLAQIYSIGYDMSRPYRVAAGLQDNGSLLGPSTKRGGGPIRLEDWSSVGGGDGMYNAFDTKNNRYLYNESQFGSIQRVDLVSGEPKNIGYRGNNKLRYNWCAPIFVSKHNSDVVYHAANVVLRSTNRGESWTEASPDLTTNDTTKLTNGKGGDGNIQFCTISTFDESPIDARILWVGTDDGNVQVTTDGGKKWNNVSTAIPGNQGYWVSRVAASHSSPSTAYASFTGLRNDDFKAYIYKTTDYGKTWTSIASNLPDYAVNVIREDVKNPNLLFVGTDAGVYVSLDGGKQWQSFKGNMPTQAVHDLQIHPREGDLIVGTHGRGFFIANIKILEEFSVDVMAKDAHLFEPKPFVRWATGLNQASSSQNYPGKSEAQAMEIYYFLKTKSTDSVKISILRGSTVLREIKGSGEAGIQKVTWDMRRVRARTEEEKTTAQDNARRGREFGGRSSVDPNFISESMPEGVVTITLSAGKITLMCEGAILQDEWSLR
ncbi:MAG: hypothetical protein V1799_15990 [bacterium]